MPENMRMQCSTCNQLIRKGRDQAPYERTYDRHGDFLGFGFDMEPRGAHVGKSDPKVRERAPKYSCGPPRAPWTG